ncbi:hypothetical protein COCCADRAFT_104268 [Bipolaris zeicola 26-R-13]|uniref:Uncharacterized protein n=1 Tax=Cochliobolus carbonum (strain 26-R-13) TaxID=930089 RepID=W6XS34_COCC2|nr:uncharacterized protein COCCADRAFT_104268 [Bipolaris zeicola 26-R-13]EUC30307.1 hypothetical protein COCCADRAFT_104268 [Bipolaris zeicola 26-R-13]
MGNAKGSAKRAHFGEEGKVLVRPCSRSCVYASYLAHFSGQKKPKATWLAGPF